MGTRVDVPRIQQAFDALVAGDHHAALGQFADDLVLIGAGGCVLGRTKGLDAVLGRFADVARLTHGTFGTEVEAVFTGGASRVVAITRHWAVVERGEVRASQAVVIDIRKHRIRRMDLLRCSGDPSGIWD